MKKYIKTWLVPFLLLSCTLPSCGETSSGSENSPSEETSVSQNGAEEFKVGDDYHKLENVEEDIVNGFYDGFDSLEKKNWQVLKGYWGANNGGVSPENVSITEEGTLALSGNGLYYSKNEIESFGQYKDGRKCGASLISNFKALPGHYEIKRKVHPRIGACTAFWTYGNRPVEGESENENAEIDVELPGGSKSGKITYKKALYTNWVTEKASDSIEADISETNQDTVAYNDNQWHTFGFDWYTDPGRVVYFCDGKITNVSTTFVPTLAGRLWVGVWFPNGFTGNAAFERDYRFVDYIKYNPFKDQPYTDYDAIPSGSLSSAPDSIYQKKPIKTPVSNKISNGDFEYAGKLDSSSSSAYDSALKSRGWTFTKKVSEKKAQKEVCWIENGTRNQTYSAFVKDGGVLRQTIEAVYDGYEFDYEFKAKTEGTKGGTVSFQYYGANEETTLDTYSVNVNSLEGNLFKGTLKAPKGTEKIRIEVRAAENGNKIRLEDIAVTAK